MAAVGSRSMRSSVGQFSLAVLGQLRVLGVDHFVVGFATARLLRDLGRRIGGNRGGADSHRREKSAKVATSSAHSVNIDDLDAQL